MLHTVLAYVFGILLLVGGCALLLTIDVDTARGEVNCGSAVTGVRYAVAEHPPGGGSAVPVCEAEIGFRRAWAWPVASVGLVGMVVLILLAPYVRPTPRWWREVPRGVHR